ncbi:MAG: ABC transporter ATP-binding protein [Clostridia bacterium]
MSNNTPSIAPEKQKFDFKIFKKIFVSAKTIRNGLTIASIFSLLSILIVMYAPMLMGDIIDEINTYWKVVSAGGSATLDMPFIGKMSLILILLYALAAGFSIVKMFKMNNTVSRHFTASTRIDLSSKLCKLPVSYVDTTTNGEFISRMTNDVSVIGNTVHNVIDLVIQGIFQLLLLSIMMIAINWAMAIIVLTVIPVSVVMAAILAHKSEKYWAAMHKSNGEINGIVEESYANFALIKAFNAENSQANIHGEVTLKRKTSLYKATFYSQIVQPVISYTNKIAYVLVCILGGYFAINGIITVGDVIAIILYSQMLSQPLMGIANGLSMLQHTTVATKRVYEILDKDEMVDTNSGENFNGTGDVSFHDVSFSYKQNEPLIKNLNVEVKSGQKVAIVGPTGAGKTTLVNLLMRFYDVDKGKIMIDGVNIDEVPRDKVRNEFAMVLQDTWLFNGTVFDNVAYGKDGATMDEVVEACDMSYCDHFIRTLPNGYNTIINDDTTNLSGGQKQLLTIARAFLSDRKMLILDEATSSVDTRTEILIQKAMNKLMKGRTCFVIAHRLSTIIDADLILVIDNGDIVEKGTHSELLLANGLYAKIYNSQYSLIKM